MTWTIEVDETTCIGSGMCTATAPDHFTLDGATATVVQPNAEPADEVRDAAESCPVEAISVREAATGELVAPEEF